MRVLVVDSDRDRAHALIAQLEAEQIETRYAAGGFFALTMLERELPDCIVARPPLPDVSAADLTEIVQRDFALSRVRIVLVRDDGKTGGDGPFDLVFDACAGVQELAWVLKNRFSARPRRPETPAESERHSAERKTMSGSLAVLGFAEVTQAISQSSKCGCLSVRIGKHRGWVYFLDGRAIHAAFLGLRGASAFERLYEVALREDRGSFDFRPMSCEALAGIEPSIGYSTQELLLRAAISVDKESISVVHRRPRSDYRRQG